MPNSSSPPLPPKLAFAESLRAFQSGNVTYEELLERITGHLAAGATSAELLDMLLRREYVAPIPESQHDGILVRLRSRSRTTLPPDSSSALDHNGGADSGHGGDGSPTDSGAASNPSPADVSGPPDPTTPAVLGLLPDFNGAKPHRPSGRAPVWLLAGSVALLVVLLLSSVLRPTHRAPSANPPPPIAESTAQPEATPATPHSPAAGPGKVLRDCETCPFMTLIPAGRFSQGSGPDDAAALPSERPQHRVVVTAPFGMSTNDVTVGQFAEFISATQRDMQGCDVYDGGWRHLRDSSWKNPGFQQNTRHPVTCVSWNDAIAYTRWLSNKTRHRYRLPSAAEWEYAARAGGDSALPQSSGPLGVCANANVADLSAARRYPGWDVFDCDDGYVNTAPVGSFKANAFGLDDMLGNVFVWTMDCWHENYSGAPTDASARMDGDCTDHELRGGSWFSSSRFVRASYRNHFAADYRTSSVGFRLVRTLE